MSRLVRIPEATSLGLHAMAILAKRPDDTISTGEIAEILHASSAHLAKVLKNLEQRGFVNSMRGPSGGFSLEGDATKIVLMDIYEAIEGPLPDDEGCVLDSSLCSGDLCIFGDLLRSFQTEFIEVLSKTTLQELAQSMRNLVV